jgi:hypothetical protein
MKSKNLRELIIDLLDDEHGINDISYTRLYELACECGSEDVVKKAEETNGRWFLGEDDAEELRLQVAIEEL